MAELRLSVHASNHLIAGFTVNCTITISRRTCAAILLRRTALFLLQVGNGELNVRVPNVTDNALAFPPELILPWSDYEDNELELVKFVFAENLTEEIVRAFE